MTMAITPVMVINNNDFLLLLALKTQVPFKQFVCGGEYFKFNVHLCTLGKYFSLNAPAKP